MLVIYQQPNFKKNNRFLTLSYGKRTSIICFISFEKKTRKKYNANQRELIVFVFLGNIFQMCLMQLHLFWIFCFVFVLFFTILSAILINWNCLTRTWESNASIGSKDWFVFGSNNFITQWNTQKTWNEANTGWKQKSNLNTEKYNIASNSRFPKV